MSRSLARRILGNIAGAQEDSERAHSIRPDDERALNEAAQARIQAGDEAGALEILVGAVVDNNPLLRAMRASLLAGQRQLDKARSHLDAVLQAIPTFHQPAALRSAAAEAALHLRDVPLAKKLVGETVRALETAGARGIDVAALLERHKIRLGLAERFARAYRNYCWPVESLRDIRIAPFHVMATEGSVHADKDHAWHMNTISSFVSEENGLLMRTPFHLVDLADPASEAAATTWWENLTEAGGEGAVVKPLAFVATTSRGLLQPAVKCRGREYLRIIYGPEYTLPEHLTRLRERGLSGKRSLALREFALGIEGLERFVQREPLRRVHECVFGVLALESEPVDPRL